MQFAKEHHLEIEQENELGFIISPTLEKEFKEKTGYSLEDYQQGIVAEEQGEYFSINDLKKNLEQWKKEKGL
jgi:hypothetical protein